MKPLIVFEDDLYRFIKIINPGSHSLVPYSFWVAKYPVTNRQYARFLKADDFTKVEYWLDFPKFDKNSKFIDVWKDDGLKWLQGRLKDFEYFPRESWKIEPAYWDHPEFGVVQPDNPVVGITWFEANAYCKWLAVHWNELPESSVNSEIVPKQIRLPLETEWVIAAGGDRPNKRYPWDAPGKVTTDVNGVIKRANVIESKIEHTTPVNQYKEGMSSFGVMDMAGNVWEWQANYFNDQQTYLSLRGSSWGGDQGRAHVANRLNILPANRSLIISFRVMLLSIK